MTLDDYELEQLRFEVEGKFKDMVDFIMWYEG